MKINITKKQYGNLMLISGIANSVLGNLSDMLPNSEYKNQAKEINDLEEYFLQYADDYDYGEFTRKNGKETVFNDEMNERCIMPIINEYDKCQFFSSLAAKLAWRDFKRDHTKKEIDEMAKINGGYFGVEIYDYEKKYWDEFEDHGFDRVEMNKTAKAIND
ncbi:hypothetical protein KKC88_03225 [Patescibacteria group bacterium]|nr:hypothetical protein [Patescibacteria group bacterium]MBU1963008.1 hypothetical protein [Patescibacteria group bacterium]